MNIPKMCTIKETAEQFGLPEYRVRQWCKSGEIVCVQCGNRYLINLDKLVAYLNGEKPPAKEDAPELRRIRRIAG